MRKILLLFFLTISSTLLAQLPRSLLKSTEKVTTFDEYDGSMYMKARYKESSIINEQTGTYDVKLKYNIYTDALELTQGSKLYEIVKSPTLHARIDDDYFYYCDFKNQRGLNRSGYYILVELNDKYRIYKKLTLKITEPEKKQHVNNGIAEAGELRSITSYYIEEDGVIVQLPLNKKDILAIFTDKGPELKEYLKKEKIRLRKEEDLIRFVARYNALKSAGGNPSQSLLTNISGRD